MDNALKGLNFSLLFRRFLDLPELILDLDQPTLAHLDKLPCFLYLFERRFEIEFFLRIKPFQNCRDFFQLVFEAT